METEIRVRIPQLVDVRRAVEIYYSRLDLSNADIKELFGKLSSSTIAKLRAKAEEQRREEGIAVWSSTRVNTVCAYKAWGLDITDLEKRVKALDKLNRNRRSEGVEMIGIGL